MSVRSRGLGEYSVERVCVCWWASLWMILVIRICCTFMRYCTEYIPYLVTWDCIPIRRLGWIRLKYPFQHSNECVYIRYKQINLKPKRNINRTDAICFQIIFTIERSHTSHNNFWQSASAYCMKIWPVINFVPIPLSSSALNTPRTVILQDLDSWHFLQIYITSCDPALGYLPRLSINNSQTFIFVPSFLSLSIFLDCRQTVYPNWICDQCQCVWKRRLPCLWWPVRADSSYPHSYDTL